MPTVEINGTSVHYRIDGPGRGPVLMLAGSLASDLTMWDAQIPALTGAGYQVLRYDSRGHGRSAAPPGPYTIEQLTEDALRLLDRRELDRVHFCGLSMGGMVGQMLGARHGDRLLSLSLCDTSAYMPPADLWDERIAAAREQGMAAVVDATIDRWFTPAGQSRLPDEVDKVRRMIANTAVEGYCASCAAIRDMDQRNSLAAIEVATLVVVGEQDPSTPVEAARLIHERIAASRLAVIPDAAHFVNVEQSTAFNAVLLDFLESGRA